MGGVATGLAVGAGVMAAQAIGRNLMGDHPDSRSSMDGLTGHDPGLLERNPDMGGQNFGIADSGSWDDGGGAGGGDWDD